MEHPAESATERDSTSFSRSRYPGDFNPVACRPNRLMVSCDGTPPRRRSAVVGLRPLQLGSPSRGPILIIEPGIVQLRRRSKSLCHFFSQHSHRHLAHSSRQSQVDRRRRESTNPDDGERYPQPQGGRSVTGQRSAETCLREPSVANSLQVFVSTGEPFASF
jgi:hypothetical protein